MMSKERTTSKDGGGRVKKKRRLTQGKYTK
jgi:hypothetical protein